MLLCAASRLAILLITRIECELRLKIIVLLSENKCNRGDLRVENQAGTVGLFDLKGDTKPPPGLPCCAPRVRALRNGGLNKLR
jgi:hypothetical protein